MNEEEKKAMQAFIDRSIRPSLQEHYPNFVACYAQAWEAALKWRAENPAAPILPDRTVQAPAFDHVWNF